MRRKAGIACIVLGLLLLLGAGAQFTHNEWESRQADRRARQAAAQVHRQITLRADGPTAPSDPAADTDMTVVQIDGYGYIGCLSIPKLDLELPVMDQWDEERLKTAPCRYSGSTLTDDLVLAGHNYRRHFGPIRRLSAGDEVVFTDMDGNETTYLVAVVETVPSDAVEETVSGVCDLTLITCTYGGADRIRVSCDRSDAAGPRA